MARKSADTTYSFKDMGTCGIAYGIAIPKHELNM